jgi:O-antigen/teichoic acid export membrane protein
MSWKTVGNALSSSGGQIIILEKKQKWAVIRNIVGCAVNVGLNLWLIPLWGILGSAWTSIITIFVSGWLCNLLIPPYQHVFSVQTKAIFMGWKDLTKIKKIIRGV